MFCGITLLMSLFVYSNSQCVNVQNNVTYYTSKGEQIRWRADSLIKGNGLTYNLTPSSTVMRYHPAFDQISDQEEHYGALYKVYALRAYDIASTGAWANKFAFLEREEGKYIYDIYYTEGNVIHMDHTPQFTAKVILSDKTDNLFECFDLEYINPELWIVDCVQMYADGTPLENYIYFVNKTDSPQTIKPKRIQTPNHKNYKSIKGRKIQYHTYYKQDIGEGESIDLPEPKHPIRIMLRGQQAFNSETGTPDVLDQDCFIDVILRLENKTTYDTEQVLNKSRISTDTGRTVNFTLIDFKILPNGDVYILDAYEGIYVYRVTEEGNWKYLRTIQTMIGRAYAFDVNNRLLNDGFSYLHIAVVYESNMLTFINGKQQNGYRLPFSSTYPLTVSLSQQYVVIVHNQYLYLYNSEKPYLLHKELLISQTVLVNPYAPDVVLVSNIFTRRYELSDGYLASENSDAIEQTSRTFTATDGTNTCKAVITYQVLSTSNNHVLPLGHDPFPTMITYPAIPFVLQDIASGPNLQFITPDVHNTHVEVKVHFLWELDVKEIQWFDAKDVIYADVLVDPHHETTNKFYLFLQHKNKTVIVWDCLTVNYNDHHCTCEKEVQINLPIGLSRINSQFGWNSFDKDDLTFQFLVSDYEIQIWDAYNGEPEKIGNITFAEKPENKITSFTALKKNVFIVHEQSKEIDVVSAIYPKLQSYPIDKDLMDSYETGCSWTPKRVYGNPTTKSEFVWIVTDDCVIMGDQRYHFTLIDAFPIPEKYEVEVAVGEKTFYIITTTTNNNGSIREYNYENLNDIYLMKFMPLYDKYRLQTPLTIDFAYETGFLFVRALDIEDNKTVFLIYESNILYRDCLHKVVKTGELIPDGQLIETAASGYDQMFVYFNDLKTEHIFVVLRDSLMDLHPTAISDAYATQLTAAVSISNTFSTEPPVNIKYPVKFINTQSIVRVNETVLYKTENHFESITTQQYINLTNNGWYWGHVTRFTIKCRQCETHLVDILDPVTHGSEGSFFANYEFIAGATFQTSVVYLTDQSLVFQNDNDTLKFVQKIDGIQYCNSLTTFNQYIMVSCVNNKAEALIYIFNCDLANQKCTPVEPQSQVLPKIQIISKLVYLNNVLYILDLDQSNPRHYQGSLHVFSLTLDNQWSIKNEQIIDAKYFGFTEDQEFYISDFDVVQFQIGNTNYYKIMIQTTVEKTYFVQMYSDNGLLKYNHKDSLNLANLLNTDYAIKSDTYFYQIRAQKSGVANNLLTITALITTNNVAQYAITFSFDVTDPLNKGSPVKNSITVPYLLNHYGTFLAINKLTIGQGHAAVAYTNYTHLLIAIYKLPDLSIEGEDVVTKMLTMTGSEVVEYWRPGTSFVMVLQKDPVYGEPVMYANLFESLKTSNHLLVKYTIHDFPRIIIYDGTKVESQWVELGIANDFSEALGIFEIINKGQPPTPPEPENKTSLTWLWITLGVIGGLIVVGGVGFVVYTKFYKRSTPHVTDSAKVSLMQQ